MGNNTEKEIPVSLMNLRFITPWIIYVLRMYSSKDHPMSALEISEKYSLMCGVDENEYSIREEADIGKTVRRKLDDLCKLGRKYEKEDNEGMKILTDMASMVYGGRVVVANPGKRPLKYYFEPFLSNSDVSQICSSIESNRNVKKKDAFFFIQRLSSAFLFGKKDVPYNKEAKRLWDLEPYYGNEEDPSVLRKIGILQTAIEEEYKVDILAGMRMEGEKRKQYIIPGKVGKSGRWNPFWIVNVHGETYVIMTAEGESEVCAVPIYEILEVVIAKEENGENGTEFVKREPIPRKFNGKVVKYLFLYAKSTDYRVPDAVLYSLCGGNPAYCTFYCPGEYLSVPLRYFGDQVTIKKKSEEEDLYLLRANGNYAELKEFFLSHSPCFIPESPEKLKEEVKTNLTEMLSKY